MNSVLEVHTQKDVREKERKYSIDQDRLTTSGVRKLYLLCQQDLVPGYFSYEKVNNSSSAHQKEGALEHRCVKEKPRPFLIGLLASVPDISVLVSLSVFSHAHTRKYNIFL